MIIYLVTLRNAFAVENYLRTWGREMRGGLRTMYYENVRFHRTWPAATYIFSDIERLNASQLAVAIELARELKAAGFPVLNEPSRTPRRYDLLKTLHRHGVNQFNAYRVNELPQAGTLQFPVFVRRANAHDGSLTALLKNETELAAALESAEVRTYAHEELIVVEFVDTSDGNGIFRKYSVLRVGPSIVPRHVLQSRDWMNKSEDMVTEQSTREEEVFCLTNPHATEFRRIFDLAGVDYGRVDYALRDGAIQVWEINTSPVVIGMPSAINPLRMEVQRRSAGLINEAFRNLDTVAERASVSIELDHSLLDSCGYAMRQRVLRPLGWWSRTFPKTSKRVRKAIGFRG